MSQQIAKQLQNLDTSSLSQEQQVLSQLMGLVMLLGLNEEFRQSCSSANPQTPNDFVQIALSTKSLDPSYILKMMELKPKIEGVSKNAAASYFNTVLSMVPKEHQHLFNDTKSIFNEGNSNDVKENIADNKQSVPNKAEEFNFEDSLSTKKPKKKSSAKKKDKKKK
jgi:hypothetical protein